MHLPTLASSHPDPEVRHLVFRLIGVIVRLVPDMMRLDILRGFFEGEEGGNEGQEMMRQGMRIAAIGLLKDLVLEAIRDTSTQSPSSKNAFASPILWQTFAPIIFRPYPPDLFVSRTVGWSEVAESREGVRLIECLTLFFVIAKRDTKNLVCCQFFI